MQKPLPTPFHTSDSPILQAEPKVLQLSISASTDTAFVQFTRAEKRESPSTIFTDIWYDDDNDSNENSCSSTSEFAELDDETEDSQSEGDGDPHSMLGLDGFECVHSTRIVFSLYETSRIHAGYVKIATFAIPFDDLMMDRKYVNIVQQTVDETLPLISPRQLKSPRPLDVYHQYWTENDTHKYKLGIEYRADTYIEKGQERGQLILKRITVLV